jgi:tartrate dehydrogenase/decarboxylase / D-malate dehydrogenase
MAKSGKKDQKLRIALIPGDGIGHEVVPAGVEVLELVGRKFGINFK